MFRGIGRRFLPKSQCLTFLLTSTRTVVEEALEYNRVGLNPKLGPQVEVWFLYTSVSSWEERAVLTARDYIKVVT